MKQCVRMIADLWADGRGHLRFWWAGLTFLIGAGTWVYGVRNHDLSANLWSCIDFFCTVSNGRQFWQETAVQRRIRTWKRDREQ
jgi:hypothetical protein